MNFEFDPKKSDANKNKHGIDFIEAQELWKMNQGFSSSAKSAGNIGVALSRIEMKTLELSLYAAPGMRRLSFMKAKELDKAFDEGESVLEHFDLSKARRPNQEQKRVNVDFPLWMIQSLDKEAKRLGVPRQSIIKIWLAERLRESAKL
jgi:hypothetical protein